MKVYFRHDWSMVNRPNLWGDWVDKSTYSVTLDWGNGHSDPVWAVDVYVTWPRWFMRTLGRLWPSRYKWEEYW